MQKDEIVKFILDYVQREIKLPRGANELEFNFLESGYIDSIELFSFLVALEQKFGVEINEEDLGDKNLATVGGMADFVEKKIAAGARA